MSLSDNTKEQIKENFGYGGAYDEIIEALETGGGTPGTVAASTVVAADAAGDVNFPSGTNLQVQGSDLFTADGNLAASLLQLVDTYANLKNLVLDEGRFAFDSTNRVNKMGDGVNAYKFLQGQYVEPALPHWILYGTITRATARTGTITVPASRLAGMTGLIPVGTVIDIFWEGASDKVTATVDSFTSAADSLIVVSAASGDLPVSAATAVNIALNWPGQSWAANNSTAMPFLSGGMRMVTFRYGKLEIYAFIFDGVDTPEAGMYVTYLSDAYPSLMYPFTIGTTAITGKVADVDSTYIQFNDFAGSTGGLMLVIGMLQVTVS